MALPDYAAYLDRWRELHGLEPDRMRGGFLDRYYRLPYAVARVFARLGMSPGMVTAWALLVTLAALAPWAAGGRWPLLAGLLVLVGGLLDQVDGAVAVLTDRASAYGAVWDSTADRLADLAILAGPALWVLAEEPHPAGPLVALVAAGAGTFLLEYVRARCQAVGYVTGQVVTVGERPTRVVLGALLALTVGAGLDAVAVTVTGWLLTALTVVSVGRLLRDAAGRDAPRAAA